MNHCVVQQNSFAACEEIWGRSVEHKETVVCPKPRRLGLVHTTAEPSYVRPLRWHMGCHQQEDCDAKAGKELLDIILAREGASSPPFFSGSPPTRVSNPLIQDSNFLNLEKINPPIFSPRAANPSLMIAPPLSPSSTCEPGGRVRAVSFGNDPAVRIEGFNCLNRDRGNCNSSIPALA